MAMMRNRAVRRKLKAKHNPVAKQLREKEHRQRIVDTKDRDGGAKNLLKEFEEGKLDDI